MQGVRNTIQMLVMLVLLYVGVTFYLISLPRPVDYGLMAIKYLILAFFIKAIVLDMDGRMIADFLQSPYNKVVDVKMLYLFTKMSGGVVIFLLGLFAISAVVQNFWCRYLCPYGALLGLLGYLSPITVTRNAELCTDCKLCSRACPNHIDVASRAGVESPECTGCLNCVHRCPRKGALELRLLGKRSIGRWSFVAMVIALPMAIYILAKITGHWDTSLTYVDWSTLIPQADRFSHF